ncbi:MAG: hypothetical protein EOP66_04625 [Sphingomonas sp.]|jgi:hypothetical protein|nr:MAG: hypothetical protein EOP66_04625 [Sphingomonas sp.]
MALTELQNWIMRELGTYQGKLDGLPTRAGVDAEEMEQAIEGLVQRRYVTVIGPPNQNSYIGKDVDELRLQPNGVGYVRTLR